MLDRMTGLFFISVIALGYFIYSYPSIVGDPPIQFKVVDTVCINNVEYSAIGVGRNEDTIRRSFAKTPIIIPNYVNGIVKSC